MHLCTVMTNALASILRINGMLCLRCSHSAKFWMWASTPPLVLALFRKSRLFIALHSVGDVHFIGICVKRGIERVFGHS